MAILEGIGVWRFFHESLFGLFGICAWALPVTLFALTALFAMNKNIGGLISEFVCAGVFVLFLSGVVHVAGNSAEYLADVTFLEHIKDAWNYDSVISSGGVMGVFIGDMFAKTCGKVPSMIIMIIVLVAMVVLFTGTTLISVVRFFSKPVKKVGSFADAKIEQGMRRHEENEAERAKRRQQKLESERKKAEEAEKEQEFNPDFPVGPEAVPKFEFSENDNYLPDYIIPDNAKENKKEEQASSFAPPVVIEEAEEEEDGIPIQKPPKRIRPTKTEPESEKVETITPSEVAKATKEIEKEISEQEEIKEQEEKAYMKPPLTCLSLPALTMEMSNSGEIEQNSALLIKTLESFNVKASITGVFRGPSVTRYELLPAEGVKISKITNLADDIALRLAASGVRIEAPIPNKAAIGIEVPNKSKVSVTLREIIDTDVYKKGTAKSILNVALGKDIAGNVICADLAKMPHLLIAGTTGSGKSVCINSMIMSILFNADPNEVRLLMIDPKQVEFTVYSGIPHLLVPVVSDPRKASGALNWAVSEMLRRYKEFSEKNVRDIGGYNKLADRDPSVERMNRIVIFIDELSDLMMVAQSEVEDAICRLAQMARAAGMHLVIATQRPSVDVITGLIKANIPSRIALSVSSQIDSRTILDVAGAEKLLGNGDMLYNPVGMSKPLRVQGAFVSDMEVEDVVTFIKNQEETSYDEDIMDEIERQAAARKKGADVIPEENGEAPRVDEKLHKAIEIVVDAQMASTTLLQRKLGLGYARAARLIDELEERKIVGPFEGSKPRKVLITKQQWMEMCALSDETPTSLQNQEENVDEGFSTEPDEEF
ncbi:MAG: DNA translocase FtsK [Clostridia bacterium]|nr:DNA translocase FtsK [Clostridia bacterium]